MSNDLSRSAAAALAVLMLATALPARAAETWKLGVVEAKGDAGILFMPQRTGAKYGVDIQILQFASSTLPVKALLGGSIDAFTTSPSVALVAMSRGARLKFIGCNWPGATYTLYGAPGVKTIADLKGKSIGVSGPGSMPDQFAREVLRANNMPTNQVIFANAGGGSDRFRALLAGVVKATATTGEFEPEARKHGINILARAHDVTPNFARNCIVTTDKILATRRDSLVRFLAANMDAVTYAQSHRKETLALTRQVAKLPPTDASPEFIYDEAIRQKDLDATLAVPVGKLQWIEDMLVRNKSLDRSQNVTAFIDDGPRRAALKILKP